MPIIGRLLGHTQAATTARYAHLDNDPLRRATGRRQALGRQALSELENWPPLLAAECAIVENIDFLEKKMTDLPQPPTAVADVMLAQEIRQHIRRQKSRIDVAMRCISDPLMLRAILTAPACLSGLSDAELSVVRERARTALHPEQAQMQQELAKSRDDLGGGVDAARRMVRERCQIGEDDSIRKPLLRSRCPWWGQ